MSKVINLKDYLESRKKEYLIQELKSLDYNNPEIVEDLFVQLVPNFVELMENLRTLNSVIQPYIERNTKFVEEQGENWAMQNKFDNDLMDNFNKLTSQVSTLYDALNL